jgi:hypothetical protein
MAQDRFVNVTLESSPVKKNDMKDYNHGKTLGASASGDMTISYDSAKFTSLTLLRSACNAALDIAAQSLKP